VTSANKINVVKVIEGTKKQSTLSEL